MAFQVRDPIHPHTDSEIVTSWNLRSSETPVSGMAFAGLAQPEGSETILLVEDEAFVRRVTEEVLGSAGYSVIAAAHATEALRLCGLRSESIDLLIADIILPGMSGCDLALHFETLHPRVRVLLMTGYGENMILRDRSVPPRRCIAKPFSTRILLTMVREALDAAQQHSRPCLTNTRFPVAGSLHNFIRNLGERHHSIQYA